MAIWGRWLKLRSRRVGGEIVIGACEYSGIGANRLKELARQGAITGSPDPDSKRGDWVFDRESLDRYRQLQLGAAHGAALDLAQRLGL